VGRHVKRIQAPGAAHGRANGQRLAARARAKIHHHLAALGVQQQASSCEPSSCTSMAPRVKASSLVSAGLPSMRRPQGEYGVLLLI
jgi:hypothetical protein